MEIDNTPIENLNVDWGNPDGTGNKAKSLAVVQTFIKNKFLELFDIIKNVYTKTQMDQKLGKKRDETVIVESSSTEITIDADKRYVVTMSGNTAFTLNPPPQDGYSHAYELDLITEDYAVSFQDNINWVKPLEILPNTRYLIIIDQNLTAMWAAVTN